MAEREAWKSWRSGTLDALNVITAGDLHPSLLGAAAAPLNTLAVGARSLRVVAKAIEGDENRDAIVMLLELADRFDGVVNVVSCAAVSAKLKQQVKPRRAA